MRDRPQWIGDDHPRHVRAQHAHYLHGVAGGLDRHLLVLAWAHAKALEPRASPVDSTVTAQPSHPSRSKEAGISRGCRAHEPVQLPSALMLSLHPGARSVRREGSRGKPIWSNHRLKHRSLGLFGCFDMSRRTSPVRSTTLSGRSAARPLTATLSMTRRSGSISSSKSTAARVRHPTRHIRHYGAPGGTPRRGHGAGGVPNP
jgi:hypothetical protein